MNYKMSKFINYLKKLRLKYEKDDFHIKKKKFEYKKYILHGFSHY